MALPNKTLEVFNKIIAEKEEEIQSLEETIDRLKDNYTQESIFKFLIR